VPALREVRCEAQMEELKKGRMEQEWVGVVK